MTSEMIKPVLTNTPRAREKPTNPGLYSFLSGLKNVWIKRGKEKSRRNALLTEAKNCKSASGLSKNQNLRKIIGNVA